MIQNTKFVNNLVMELKNVSSNFCNVIINKMHLMFLFFPKILKIELNKGLKVCLRIEIP